jgi:hypothetical protein
MIFVLNLYCLFHMLFNSQLIAILLSILSSILMFGFLVKIINFKPSAWIFYTLAGFNSVLSFSLAMHFVSGRAFYYSLSGLIAPILGLIFFLFYRIYDHKIKKSSTMSFLVIFIAALLLSIIVSMYLLNINVLSLMLPIEVFSWVTVFVFLPIFTYLTLFLKRIEGLFLFAINSSMPIVYLIMNFDYSSVVGYLTWVMFVVSIFFAIVFSTIALVSYKSWSKKLSV